MLLLYHQNLEKKTVKSTQNIFIRSIGFFIRQGSCPCKASAANKGEKTDAPPLNCTPFVRQVWYNTCTKEWGVFSMPKGVPNKRYTPEFKKLVVETMQEEKLSYSETCRRFEVNSRDRIKSWERIYLEEGAEGLAIERRGRCSKGRPPKQLPKQVEEDLLAEVQRLRAENDYLKNLQALVLEDERRQHKKRW